MSYQEWCGILLLVIVILVAIWVSRSPGPPRIV